MGWLKRRITEDMEPTEYELARRWIPVTERFPDKGQRVLILGGVDDVCIATYCGAKWGRDHVWVGDDDSAYKPTHWMPLPAPPTDAK